MNNQKENFRASKFEFYYDETEHSRKINYNTINANNYCDNFITIIIGWPSSDNEVLSRYKEFETKYSYRKDCNGEIKSTTLKQKQFKYGFASLKNENLRLVSDFLSIFNADVYINLCVQSKIEYLVQQLLSNYKNGIFIDADKIKYSITKALIVYRPMEVIECIFENSNLFLEKLKDFFRNRIKYNKKNIPLKYGETAMFEYILEVLSDISELKTIDWDYRASFRSFECYVKYNQIHNYDLIIDKEGKSNEASKTLKAAKEAGLMNIKEEDSMQYPGLRISDMLAGIISRIIKSLNAETQYQSLEDGINKKILSKNWFQLNQEQFLLYKKMYKIVCNQHLLSYNLFTKYYSDDLIELIALLSFINKYSSVEDINEDLENQGEYFNNYLCQLMDKYFSRMSVKLPSECITIHDEDYFYNNKGGRIFINPNKQPILPINEGSQTFKVLSVGMLYDLTPIITIQNAQKTESFKLPIELFEWAESIILLAAKGEKIFPAEVIFSKYKNKYYADIL